MTFKPYSGQRGIAWLPITGWLPTYPRDWLNSDLISGITLAAFCVPVVMAYVSLAGLPSQAGLYASILAPIAYALFGTSRQLAISPTTSISMLVASGVGVLAAGDPGRYGALAAMAVLLVGALVVLAWLLKLGQIVNLISDPVLTGFKFGVGLQIASTQLPKLFGIAGAEGNFFQRIGYLFQHLGQTNLPSLAIGLACIGLLLLGEKWFPHKPISLVVVVLSILLMGQTNLAAQGGKTAGAILQGLPALMLPSVNLAEMSALLPLALAVFLLSYVEGMSAVRAFADMHQYDIDADQELLALGAANLAVGQGQGYPVGGGMSQSVVNDNAGALTAISGLVAAVVIAIVVLFFTQPFSQLPEPILAAVVPVAIKGVINIPALQAIRQVSRPEFRWAVATILGVLFFGILKGVLWGVIFSILSLLNQASNPHTAILGRVPGSQVFSDIQCHPENEQVSGVMSSIRINVVASPRDAQRG